MWWLVGLSASSGDSSKINTLIRESQGLV
jgi:hypothetical protein